MATRGPTDGLASSLTTDYWLLTTDGGEAMSSAMRRGGIPGPESRTGLTRPSMTEAEFERRLGSQPGPTDPQPPLAMAAEPLEPASPADGEPSARSATATSRSRTPRSKPAKPRRVQRMFAIEEE